MGEEGSCWEGLEEGVLHEEWTEVELKSREGQTLLQED